MLASRLDEFSVLEVPRQPIPILACQKRQVQDQLAEAKLWARRAQLFDKLEEFMPVRVQLSGINIKELRLAHTNSFYLQPAAVQASKLVPVFVWGGTERLKATRWRVGLSVPPADSSAAGALIASGGGISLYEPEPAYEQGVQSTGYRSTPDVSLVADPAPGAWIADPYNLDPSNPFEVVGGTSLSAPAWAGLFALVNQVRAAAGEPTLNNSSPTDAQQALYMLPQTDYNVIASGTNGYTASAGYNLVTGLGTPVANRLVPDLIAYRGPGTSYPGSPVAGLQNAELVSTGASASAPVDVFSVFDALTLTGGGLGDAQGQVATSNLSSTLYESLATGGAGRTGTRPVIAAGSTTLGPASSLSPAGLSPSPPTAVTSSGQWSVVSGQWPAARGQSNSQVGPELSLVVQGTDHSGARGAGRAVCGLLDAVLDELASAAVVVRASKESDMFVVPVLPWDGVVTEAPAAVDVAPRGTGSQPVSEGRTGRMPVPQSASTTARLAVILLTAGFAGHGASSSTPRNQRTGSLHPTREKGQAMCRSP